jgi:CheY-like chemotaxis protein
VADTLKTEMSKSVLIVEKDLALMRSLREILEHRGFGVEETTDGKGAPELIRRRRPDCVVLAVDLDAGQNGYIICKKLKSESDLKAVPVIIIGDPKGFEKHQQLKTRAEDYLGKPFEAPALLDHVGGLVGFPQQELPPPVEDGFQQSLISPEELALESPGGEDQVGGLESDFELVDSMFDDRGTAPLETLAPPPIDEEIPISTDSAELELPPERTVVVPAPAASSNGLARPLRAPFHPVTYQSTPSTLLDAAEARELRAKVTELTGSLQESRDHASDLESRVRELEQEVDAKKAELETSRSAPGKAESREVFALRDAANKKDKEILRLRGELNVKEQEIVEVREKHNTLEQQVSEGSGELARRDALLKTVQARADQLAQERKRFDQLVLVAREESRSASARLSTLQTDYDALQARLGELEASLEPSQRGYQEAENARSQAEAGLTEAQGEAEHARYQLEELRARHDQAQLDLDATRAQLTTQSSSFADEISGLRQRLAETEAALTRHDQRGQRHQQRLRAQQDRLEQLKVTLQQALQTLEDTPRDADELDLDELAEA